ncbi:hypothetical protein FVE85_0658 [Porphyridium purpureum]|uniref:Uncharacterized protein n=1 Tax=Porphyridium purpureum TaxID=35688 RepID=A0A5J4YZ68_PORPP|nr:hypothetical protein FVE85_0658 [Porphyridium purpureum]|eukprot:POR8348..scf208_2
MLSFPFCMAQDGLVGDISSVFELYAQDKLFQAARALRRVEAGHSNSQEVHGHRIENSADARIQAYAHSRALDAAHCFSHLESIRSDVLEVEETLQRMQLGGARKDKWHKCFDEKTGSELKVYYQEESLGHGEAALHSLLVEGVAHTPILALASIIYETDLYSTLFWFVAESQLIQHPQPTRKMVYSRFSAPWPLADRDACMLGFAVDGLDEDGLLFINIRDARTTDRCKEGRPLSVPSFLEPRNPQKHDAVRMNITGGIELKAMGPNSTRLRMYGNVNPHLDRVPKSLINWLSRSLCRVGFHVLEDKASAIASLPHASRMRHDSVYKWLARRLHEAGIDPDALAFLKDTGANLPIDFKSDVEEVAGL